MQIARCRYPNHGESNGKANQTALDPKPKKPSTQRQAGGACARDASGTGPSGLRAPTGLWRGSWGLGSRLGVVLGLYGENGKKNGNYHLGFRV